MQTYFISMFNSDQRICTYAIPFPPVSLPYNASHFLSTRHHNHVMTWVCIDCSSDNHNFVHSSNVSQKFIPFDVFSKVIIVILACIFASAPQHVLRYSIAHLHLNAVILFFLLIYTHHK